MMVAHSEDRRPRYLDNSVAAFGRKFIRSREFSVLVLLVILILLVSLQAPRFVSLENIRSISQDLALVLILAVGETVVILGRNFDLSIGATAGLSAMTAGMLFKHVPGISSFLVFAIAIVVGVVIGLLNGVLITFLRVPSIVLTLGMLYVLSGMIYVVADGSQVNPYNVPQGFVRLSITSSVGGIPMIVIIAFVFAGLAAVCLRWTRAGRSLYALGSNPEAAELRGLPARRLVIATFMLSGAAAGLGGAVYLSYYGLVQVTAGTGLELQAIIAAIVGGVSIFGGAGTILGTTISCVLLVAISNGIAVLGYSTFLQDTIYGALLVIAVVTNSLNRSMLESRALIRPELKL